MSGSPVRRPLAIAAGTLLTATATNLWAENVHDNPFFMTDLSSGYMVAQKQSEGKSGEGKCGGKKMFKKMDKNGDGKISRPEFMQAHRKMFVKMDKNKDGMLDLEEVERMKKEKMGRKQEKSIEGKCGEGKCGEGKCGRKK